MNRAEQGSNEGVMINIGKSWTAIISLMLIGCLLGSCTYYNYFEIPKDEPPSFESRTIKLIRPEKEVNDYYLTQLKFQDDTISGVLYQNPAVDEETQRQQIRLSLVPGVVFPDSLPVAFKLPMSQVVKMDVYDLDVGKSIAHTVLFLVGTSAALYIIAMLIILATKESCPFIYAFNGHDYEFSGEIYGGAIFPWLERDDHLALPSLQPKDGDYIIKIANQAEEIQYTNFARLKVVDHPQGTEILADRAGNFYTVRDPQPPLAAISGTKTDVLQQIAERDTFRYFGDETEDPQCSKDVLTLKFTNTGGTDKAKLVLRGRSSLWLDYTLGQYLSLFGSAYDTWYAKQSSRKDLDSNWLHKHGVPLSVYIKQDGNWKFVDYFAVTGPMADRDLVMPLDLSEHKEKEIELKLECGARFWEIDYAALDFSKQENVISTEVEMHKGITDKGKDIRKLLQKDDKNYFVQPRVGESAHLYYRVPKLHKDWERTVYLHGKGHYKVIRKGSDEPQREKLEGFNVADSFARFSRQNYLQFKARLANSSY